jgi:putative tricarboxylic transport membrane protein
VVVTNWRPVVGSKGWTPAQIAYWEAVFQQVVATDDWKHELERTGGAPQFMRSRELAAYFDSQYAFFRGVLADAGLAK